MELRDIEIFLTLAEELHFGRTAQRLCVTPARITQAIKKQERHIGGLLFDRTNRSVRLTLLGEQLRNDLGPVRAGLEDSILRARMAARNQTARLRVALLPFNTVGLRHYWVAFRTRHPQWELQLRRAFVDPIGKLRNGDFDALIIWLPIEEPDLTVGPILFTDTRVLAVPDDHPLALRSNASVEMLADFQHATAPDMPDYWEDQYLPFFTPDGSRIERGLSVTGPDELIDLVSTGEIVHSFPAHVTHYWSMPHINWLPIPDMRPLTYALVWRTGTESAPLRALAEIIADLGTPTSLNDL
ncbi:LysR family transcriptional regulator [Nocardia sp. NPDC060256]|uniref:LysR family transcriptional regulator n=1 Tax=unclassified Nocardia TaxID=2637762 RepID=UPI0036532C37